MTQGPIVGTDGSISAYYVSGNLAWKITTAGGLQVYEDVSTSGTSSGISYNGIGVDDGSSLTSIVSNGLGVSVASGKPQSSLIDQALEFINSDSSSAQIVSNIEVLSINSYTAGGVSPYYINLLYTSGTNCAWAVGTWQTPTFLGTFSGGSSASTGYQALHYRIDSDDNLVIFGAVTTTALAAGTHNIFTLPSGFNCIPKKHSNPGTFIHTRSNDALVADNNRINVNSTSGNVTIVNTAAFLAGDNLYINITVPLGNLS